MGTGKTHAVQDAEQDVLANYVTEIAEIVSVTVTKGITVVRVRKCAVKHVVRRRLRIELAITFLASVWLTA